MPASRDRNGGRNLLGDFLRSHCAIAAITVIEETARGGRGVDRFLDSNRNHLGSVHAIALMNVAEMTSGLAMLAGLPPTVRGIVTTLSMTYHKKARGTIRGVARVVVPTVTEDRDFDVMAECFDREGTLVATGNVRWRLGPVRPKAG